MSQFTESYRSATLRPLPGAVTGAGASNTAVVKVPPGATYADLFLRCKVGAALASLAQIVAGFTEVRLTVSGVEKFTLTGTQLTKVVNFYRDGLCGSGYLVIPFERLWMQGAIAQLDPNYGTAGESSVQIEITQAAGSAITAIDAFARINALAEPLGKHVVIRRWAVPVTASGRYVYPDLPKIPGEVLLALHLEMADTTQLDTVAFVGDNVRVWDDVPVSLLTQIAKESNPVRTPQTGIVTMDFTNRGYDSDVIECGKIQSQALEMVFNAAPTGAVVNIIGEYGVIA